MTEQPDRDPAALVAFLERADIQDALEQAEGARAIPEALYAALGRRGLFALAIPTAHSGYGLPVRARVAVHQRVAERSASLHSVLVVHEMVALALQRFGRPEQQARWLGRMASGETSAAFAMTEPHGGSDFAQLRTHARPHESGGFVLDGVKCWASSAQRAGIVLVFVKLDEAPAALLVACDGPGLTIEPSPPLDAFGATAMGTLRFEGCTVPASAVVGPRGFPIPRVAMACLTLGRVLIASGALAIGGAALSRLITHARARVVGAEPLERSPLVKQRVADAYMGLRAGEALTAAAADALDSGSPGATRDAIVAKLAATQSAVRATALAARLHGASGLLESSPLRRLQAEARVYALIEGTEEALGCALGSDVLRAGCDVPAHGPRRHSSC